MSKGEIPQLYSAVGAHAEDDLWSARAHVRGRYPSCTACPYWLFSYFQTCIQVRLSTGWCIFIWFLCEFWLYSCRNKFPASSNVYQHINYKHSHYVFYVCTLHLINLIKNMHVSFTVIHYVGKVLEENTKRLLSHKGMHYRTDIFRDKIRMSHWQYSTFSPGPRLQAWLMIMALMTTTMMMAMMIRI